MKTIVEEIKQTRPFTTLQEQAVVNLMRTCRVLEDGLVSYFKRAEGISLSQYNVLRILRGMHPKGAKISEIADRMINRDPDVTRLVDRLVKQGLAQRERDTDDRRVVFVTITDDGLSLVNRLDEPVRQYVTAATAGLSPQRLRELDTLLDELREGVPPAA